MSDSDFRGSDAEVGTDVWTNRSRDRRATFSKGGESISMDEEKTLVGLCGCDTATLA